MTCKYGRFMTATALRCDVATNHPPVRESKQVTSGCGLPRGTERQVSPMAPISGYKPPPPPAPAQTASLTQPAAASQPAAANKNDGNFEKAVKDDLEKGGGRGGIGGDVGMDVFDSRVAESDNNIGGDDLFS